MKNNYKKRVENEKYFHDEKDILNESIKLKSLFYHTNNTPAQKELQFIIKKIINRNKQGHCLDYGCGEGKNTFMLLDTFEKVSGIDISKKYINNLNKQAAEKGIDQDKYNFTVMDAHNMTFPDNYFDFIIGEGILHHLDLETSLKEIHRVLKKGGIAIFSEPLSANPFLKIFRYFTPNARTDDEQPITTKQLKYIGKEFPFDANYFGILCAPVAVITSIILRPFPNNWLISIAWFLEKKINNINFFKRFNQYILIKISK